jgi:hypothetical protein
MEESPLTLDEQAAIERSREFILQHAKVTYDLLNLEKPLFDPHPLAALLPKNPKPANLKLQFRGYSCDLFDAEAQHYLGHAKTEQQLRSWLEALLDRVAIEVLKQVWDRTHSFHCSQEECGSAIRKGLTNRIEHWIDNYREPKWRVPEDPIEPLGGGTAKALIERSRATNAHIKETMARAEEVLRGLDVPRQEEAVKPVSPILEKSIAEILEEAAIKEDVSHEEQAARIGISRAAYFAVKAGRGGKKVRKRTQLYLEHVFPGTWLKFLDYFR